MKLQQLRYLLAIAENDLNITTAAEKLHTSQPGVSRQLRVLEDELGLRLFTRNGKSLESITSAGHEVIQRAEIIIREVNNIKNLSNELKKDTSGHLSIATTHTQARYVLPDILSLFHEKYPDVVVNLYQGTSKQIATLLQSGEAEFAIATGGEEGSFKDFVTLPCYEWERVILLPKSHDLAKKGTVILGDLVKYPLITYIQNPTGDSLMEAFQQAKLKPKIRFTTTDTEVIKSHVRKGFGIGIIADMAYSETLDSDLVMRLGSDIFPTCTTWLGFNKDLYLRAYMKDFIKLFSPQWTERRMEDIVEAVQRQ